MRENMGLYRGKRKDNGEWVEGGIVVNGDYVAIVQYSDYHSWHDFIEVIPDTAGQFTGLPDKNGKRIFEGDVCRVGNLLYKVEFKYSCWWFTILSSKVYCCPAFNSHCGDMCEIIGNIHDNPELLEVSGDD